MADNRSSYGLPSSAPALGYGGVIASQRELPVNRMHASFTVDGSGTVNRLAPLPRGTILALYFTDAPIFVNSANLLCPGSANVTFAPGDAALLRSQGDGIWRLLRVDRASGNTTIAGALTVIGAANFLTSIVSQGLIASFGPAGTTDGNNSRIFLDGSSGAGGGGHHVIRKNLVPQWLVGSYSSIIASGLSDDYVVFSNSVGEALRISLANLAATLSGDLDVVGSIKTGWMTPPQGRLSLTSGVAVMQTSVANATIVYYTPLGNIVPIYNGTKFVMTPFTERQQATTDTTKSPAAVAASKNYDMFIWFDTSLGLPRCTRGPTWNSGAVAGSDIARGTGAGSTELIWVNGIPLNKNDITNGPAAQRGTYVGTIRSNASSTIDFIFGTGGTGGVAGVFNVWNAYNRADVGCVVADTGGSYTYTSATVRQVRASAAMQVSFVVGLAQDCVSAGFDSIPTLSAAAGSYAEVGIGLDSLTAYSTYGFFGSAPSASGMCSALPINWNPGIGAHYVAALESSNGTNAVSFGASGVTFSGLSFKFRM